MTTEAEIPYVSGKGNEPNCTYDAENQSKVIIDGYVRVEPNSACAVMDA